MAVTASISISLDGYYVGSDPSPDKPLGVLGAPLHGWFEHDIADKKQLSAHEILAAELERLGALVMGLDSYEHAQQAWGQHPPFEVPVFVLTHKPRRPDIREGTTFHFVTAGLNHALDQAKLAAGAKDVGCHGGGTIQQAINHGVLDELQLHVVPILLKRGRRLFNNLTHDVVEWEQLGVVEGNGVTHLTYRMRQSTDHPH